MSKATFTPEFQAAWFKKNCAPNRAVREFNTGGPASGTLAGARRAEGLFDDGWGTDFPLTRRELRLREAGEAITDPFFATPTTPNPGNYIAQRIELLRRRFAVNEYSTASDISKLCGPGGSGMTCEGPDGGIGWRSTTTQLTAADMKRFREAYCIPGKCQPPGSATPPPGFKEFVIKGRPAHPGTARRLNCLTPPALDVNGPQLQPLPPLELGNGAAEVVPPGCVADVILGRDDGPFASGWFIITRRGVRMLVPNPLTCPA